MCASGLRAGVVIIVAMGMVLTLGCAKSSERTPKVKTGPGRASDVAPGEPTKETAPPAQPERTQPTQSSDPEEAAKEIGLPYYPGARLLPPPRFTEDVARRMRVANFVTADDPEKVAEFYKKALGDKAQVEEESTDGDVMPALVTRTEDAELKVIVFRLPQETRTRITLVWKSLARLEEQTPETSEP